MCTDAFAQNTATHCIKLRHTATYWSTKAHCSATIHRNTLKIVDAHERISTTHCNTWQHCNILRHTKDSRCADTFTPKIDTHRCFHTEEQYAQMHSYWKLIRTDASIQHTATNCNKLQHTATHCNTLWQIEDNRYTQTHPHNTLQHTVTNCNTLQQTATHFNKLQHTVTYWR